MEDTVDIVPLVKTILAAVDDMKKDVHSSGATVDCPAGMAEEELSLSLFSNGSAAAPPSQ